MRYFGIIIFFGILVFFSSASVFKVCAASDPAQTATTTAAIQAPQVSFTEKIYFIHQDQLGSVIAQTDESGNIAGQNAYSPYGDGNSQKTIAGESTERGYTGQVKDQATGLNYYNARYYDPILSRFISADQVQGGNRFAYVGGNPISNNDPSGNMRVREEGEFYYPKPTPNLGSVANNPNSQTSLPQIGASENYDQTMAIPSVAGVGYFGSGGVGRNLLAIALGNIFADIHAAMFQGGVNKLVAKADLLSGTALHGGVSSWNNLMSVSRDPNSTIWDRLDAAAPVGIFVTSVAAPVAGEIYGFVGRQTSAPSEKLSRVEQFRYNIKERTGIQLEGELAWPKYSDQLRFSREIEYQGRSGVIDFHASTIDSDLALEGPSIRNLLVSGELRGFGLGRQFVESWEDMLIANGETVAGLVNVMNPSFWSYMGYAESSIFNNSYHWVKPLVGVK